MAHFTIGQASKETGKAKSTIKKAIDNGELSVFEKTSRGFKIDASELFRVFPRKTAERSENVTNEQTETTKQYIENSILKAKLELADQRHEDAQRTADDLRSERDSWKEEFQKASALLADQRPAQPAPRRWWWQR